MILSATASGNKTQSHQHPSSVSEGVVHPTQRCVLHSGVRRRLKEASPSVPDLGLIRISGWPMTGTMPSRKLRCSS